MAAKITHYKSKVFVSSGKGDIWVKHEGNPNWQKLGVADVPLSAEIFKSMMCVLTNGNAVLLDNNTLGTSDSSEISQEEFLNIPA